jgi:uncharacterized protein YjiS (DUF1127 family)
VTTQRKALAPDTLSAPSHRLSARMARLWTRFLAAREIRRQRRALAQLENHLLDDIGLTRDDVERELSRSIWK